jgi:hypothetical protein
MRGVGSPDGSGPERRERLIWALIPAVVRRSAPPVPLVAPMLPALGLPSADAGCLLLDMSRLDASGRFCARGLLRALGWGPGHRVDLAVAGDAVVIGGSVTGRQTVGSRSELAVPAAARSLTGLAGDARVVLVAAVGQDVMVVHPQAAIVRLLAGHYAQQASQDQR